MTEALKYPSLRSSLYVMRIAAAVGCLLTCIGFLGFWGRSFYWNDTIYSHHTKGYWHVQSWRARVEFRMFPTKYTVSSFGVFCTPTDEWELLLDGNGGATDLGPKTFGFRWSVALGPFSMRVLVPHWFFVIITGAFALALKPRPRLRFSLRQLLLITMAAALVLGAICSLHHYFSPVTV